MNMNDAFLGSLIFGRDGGAAELLNKVVSKTVVDLTSDAITDVAPSMFNAVPSLETVNLKNALTIGSSGFSNCAKLTSISLPNAETLGNYALSDLPLITKITMPNVTSAGQGVCQGCKELRSVNFPKLVSVPANFCQDDIKVDLADFGAATFIGQSAFWACTNFRTLIIRTNQVCTLEHVYALNYYTPWMSGRSGGTLYVPQDLISSYQSATNWADIFAVETNQILPIEGSPYELT